MIIAFEEVGIRKREELGECIVVAGNDLGLILNVSLLGINALLTTLILTTELETNKR